MRKVRLPSGTIVGHVYICIKALLDIERMGNPMCRDVSRVVKFNVSLNDIICVSSSQTNRHCIIQACTHNSEKPKIKRN